MTRRTHRRVLQILAVLLAGGLTLAPGLSRAAVFQFVNADYVDPSGTLTSDADSGGAEDLFATVSGSFGSMTSSAGRFGNLGLSGQIVAPGSIEVSVMITNTNAFVNTSGAPQAASANFIIDGGFLGLNSAPGAMLELDLLVRADILAIGGGPVRRTDFEANVKLDDTTNPGGIPEFITSGDDIGATFDSLNGLARIPLSFQSLDLGIIDPGSAISLVYDVDIIGHFPVAPEGAAWAFSDPFNLSGNSPFPTLALSPVTTTVPEPTTAVLFLIGLAGLPLFRQGATRLTRRGHPSRA